MLALDPESKGSYRNGERHWPYRTTVFIAG